MLRVACPIESNTIAHSLAIEQLQLRHLWQQQWCHKGALLAARPQSAASTQGKGMGDWSARASELRWVVTLTASPLLVRSC